MNSTGNVSNAGERADLLCFAERVKEQGRLDV